MNATVKSTWKRFWIRAVAITLAIALAACGRGGDDADPAESPPPALSGGGADAGSYEVASTVPIRLMVRGTALENDPLAITLANQFRLAITFMPYPASYDELMAELQAADDRPDLFLLALSPARLYQLARDGMIRGIPDAMLAGFPLLNAAVEQHPIAQAHREIYGAVGYLPCVYDNNPAYAAEGGRVFYRKDWAATLGLAAPVTTEDLRQAARAFAGQNNPNRPEDAKGLVGLAVDKPERFAYLFGIDPWGWVSEGGRYIPAFYSERMLQPLTYARGLYAEGLLTFSDGGVTLNDAGILLAEGGTPDALLDVAGPVARLLRVSPEEALAGHVALADIPHAPGVDAAWGTNYHGDGWLAQADVSDGVLARFMEMLHFSLTPEGLDYVRYGLPDETYVRHEGRVRLYTDPMTYRAYDVAALFPTGRFLLGLLSQDMGREADMAYPSEVPVAARRLAADATARYYRPISGSDALCRAVNAPARDALAVDFNGYFRTIITGDEPVADMFARYRDECIRLGAEDAITEINEAVRRFLR